MAKKRDDALDTGRRSGRRATQGAAEIAQNAIRAALGKRKHKRGGKFGKAKKKGGGRASGG